MLIRRSITVATIVVLALGVLAPAATAGTAAPAAHAPKVTPARAGAGYLARQIDAGGGHLVSFGAPDISDTAYAVLGLDAVGVGRDQVAQAIAFLKTQLRLLKASDGRDDPGLLGYVIMAAVASHEDPTSFGGTKPVNNLVHRLLATARTSGPDAGLFGTADPTFDGAFRQGVALAALAGAGVDPARISRSIAWLTRQQCANSLWESYRPDPTVPCPAADPNTFTGPDTNSTSMAVQGLAAVSTVPMAAKIVAALKALKAPDGGYPFLAAPGQPSDPDSTALTIQALLATGGKPGSALAALSSFQLGCSDPVADRGAYFFPGSRDPNVFASVQAVPAAAQRTLPIAPSSPSADVPVLPCPDATPSAATVLTAATKTAQAALAGTAGPCPGTSGVTVTVDFTAFGGKQKTRCAPGAQSSGIAALQHAGFTPAGTTRYGLAFVCRINNLPSAAQQACKTTPPTNAYWAYYHALAGATSWTYSTVGASSYVPPLGSIDAWAFGNSAKPTKSPAKVRAGS